MASSDEDDVINTAGEIEDDDLFGSDDDGSDKVRELSDRELDSGDDENRNDRAREKADDEPVDAEAGKTLRVRKIVMHRYPLPNPSDGEFNSLRLPKFLGIDPYPYNPNTFELPTTDHHSDTKSADFSASSTAASTIRYRINSSNNELESNTVVYRWSDGSTTISVGDQHYELQTKPLAPPKDSKTYQEVQDSHSYFCAPSITTQSLAVVGHITNQHTVRPNKSIEDDALEKLQRSLAAATRGGHKNEEKNGPQVIANNQDPELQKKRAELAEKERMKAQRRRETAAEKANAPIGGRRLGGGLSVDDLEGRGRRAPGSGRKPAGAKRQRRRPEYDSDDDLPRGGRNREDEYDKDDGFLASSDEDLEEGGEGDDDEEEEMIDDESDAEEPKAKKQKHSKPDEASDLDADADADADLDDDVAPSYPVNSEASGVRGRKRNIIEDDEDE